MKQQIWFFILFLFVSTTFSQTTPIYGIRDKTPNVIAFTNANIVVSPQQQFTKASLVIRDGFVEAIGEKLELPEDARKIDLNGAYIYPGFIDAYTSYGIPKAKAQKSSWPGTPKPTTERVGGNHWNKAVQPQKKAATLFKADDKIAKNLRGQGIVAVQTASLDGIFRGQSAVVLTAKGMPYDLIVDNNTNHFLSFKKGSSQQSYPSSLMGSIALIRQTLYDVGWYQKAQNAYKNNSRQKKPEFNQALAAFVPALTHKERIVFSVEDELSLLRAHNIATEFNLQFIYKGSGKEYKRLNAISKLNAPLIIPVAFPEAPDVSNLERQLDVSLATLKHWDTAPENLARLEKAKVEFAITSHGLKDATKFLSAVRIAVERGLSPQKALAALTTVPAKLCGVENTMGTLQVGKMANLLIADKDIFSEQAKIYSVWISGHKYVVEEYPRIKLAGKWNLELAMNLGKKALSLEISEAKTLGAKIFLNDKEITGAKIQLRGNKVYLQFNGNLLGVDGIIRISVRVAGKEMAGTAILGDGSEALCNALWVSEVVLKAGEEKKNKEKKKEKTTSLYEVVYPNKAFGRSAAPDQPSILVVKNATVWTCGWQGVLKNTDIFIKDGKIVEVGQQLAVPQGAVVIDGRDRHITPGIVDEHSHIAISKGVNEFSEAVTAEVRIGDVVNSDDINVYRQLAGGVTTSHLLHGSANPIGGQLQVIKLRWGNLPEEMKVKDIPKSIKFALGENVKQSNWGDNFTSRYPQSRMGVKEIFRDIFRTAQEYELNHKKYAQLSKKEQQKTIPPRRDLELDAIVDILNSKMFIHCHSYVQSEILALARLANQFGFNVGTFTHVLEGYKVARELKQCNAMASCFADWWAYKFEVYDAIPYNSALMHKQGVVVSVNSDDAEMARRLNQEGAKGIKYGGVSEEDALKFVTLNPAKQLYLDHRIGSLEAGKDADFVIWSVHPLSCYSRVLQTWIEGRKYFDIEEDQLVRREVIKQKNALIQRVLHKGVGKATGNQQEEPHYHCDDRWNAVKGGN